jgi:tetratricopeptide (TPR) repeat protein
MNRLLILGLLLIAAACAGWYCVQQLHENTYKSELQDALVAHASKNDRAADQMLTTLLTKVEKWWPNSSHEVETLSWLGIIHRIELKYDVADPELRRAIGIAEQLGNTSSIAVGRAKLSLGIIARDEADYEGAEKLFAEAAAIFTKNPKEACGDDGAALLNLGYLADKQGRYQESESYLLRAESAYEDYYHSSPGRDFAKTHFELGEVYRHMHRFDASAEQYQAALKMFAKIEGPRATDVRNSETGLAIVQGRPSEGGDSTALAANQ